MLSGANSGIGSGSTDASVAPAGAEAGVSEVGAGACASVAEIGGWGGAAFARSRAGGEVSAEGA